MSEAKKKLTHADLIEMLARTAHDGDFRAKVLHHPETVLADGHYESDPKTLRFFKSLTDNKIADAARRATEHHPKDPIQFAGDL